MGWLSQIPLPTSSLFRLLEVPNPDFSLGGRAPTLLPLSLHCSDGQEEPHLVCPLLLLLVPPRLRISLMGLFFKNFSFIYFVSHCMAHGIYFQPRIEPVPPAVEVQSQPLDHQGIPPSGTLEITWSSTANLIGEDTRPFAQLVRATSVLAKEGYGQKR